MCKKLLFLYLLVILLILGGIGTYALLMYQTKTASMPLTGNTYHFGNELSGMKVSLNPPSGWKVSSKEDNSIKQYQPSVVKSLNIYVVPPEVTSDPSQTYWGGFIINVYQKESFENWFSEFLSSAVQGSTAINNRSYYVSTTTPLGNTSSQYIQTSSIAPKDIQTGFTSRYIVLGTYYTYEVMFFPNSDSLANTRIIKDIFPTLYFQ